MWWNAMSTLQQVAFVIACAATLILIVQIILMFIGSAGSDDVSDISGGGATDISVDGDVADVSGGDIDVDVNVDADVPDVDLDGDTDISVDADADAQVGDTDIIHPGRRFAPFGFKLLSLRSILAFITIGAWVLYTACYGLAWYYSLIVAIACGFAAACGMAGAMLGMEKLQSNGNISIKNAVGKIGTVYLTIPPRRSGFGKVNVLVQERYAEYDAVTDCDEPIPTSAEIEVIGTTVDKLIVKKFKKPSIVVENVK